jgi:hypothetical protein
MQRPDTTDCRHSREPFHCLFRIVATSKASPIAKLIHQALVSMKRRKKRWTQTEIGEEVGLSRYQVWLGLRELKGTGWVKSIRIGLGQPNEYELLVIDADDVDGTASKDEGFRPARHQEAGRSGTASRRTPTPKISSKDERETGVSRSDFLPREPGWEIVDGRLRYVGAALRR